jgi:phospholipase/carboxylesterase
MPGRDRGARRPSLAHLTARPGPAPAVDESRLGLQPLGLGTGRDGLVFAPEVAATGRPLPLVLMLHGAGADARSGVAPFVGQAEDAGVILLAPDSRRRTWDVLLDGYGPDVGFIDRALADVFGRFTVDPANVVVEGFSDGASYALGLGLANGDLFRRIVAFSPGYVPSVGEGRPAVFVSHGVADEVLPIDRCSRRIVPTLRRRGYDVHYREFPEGHTIPPEIVDEALGWLQGGG